MKWFTGDVGMAIQKAIQEKKVFIVFVKDDKDGSQKMEELWNDEQIAEVCSDEKCVAINILADSLPGQQFGTIYPVLCVPSTYLINNQGTPTDIIPGVLGKEEFIKRLQHAIENTWLPASTELQQIPQDTSTIEPSVDNDDQAPTTSSTGIVETQEPSAAASADVCTGSEKVEAKDEEVFNDDMESELTTEEESLIKMLRDKLKTKRDEEEKQKLKELEKKRRETGQDLQLAQRQIAEQQAVNLAKEIADRKSEEKAARERVREQIRQDRLDKTKRFEQEKKERGEVARMKTEASVAQTEKKKADASNTARLQFRLPDGSSISNQFNAEAKFLVAEKFIKDHTQSQDIRLTTVYPKHEFTSEDMVKSFRELGLLPNASIIVSQGRSTCTSSSSSSVNPMSFLMFVLSPIITILNWIASLFTGSRDQSVRSTTNSHPTQNNPREASVRHRNIPTDSTARSGNIQRLRHDDDDENATWNGNSTQQM